MTIDEGWAPDTAGAGGEITSTTVTGTAAKDRHRLQVNPITRNTFNYTPVAVLVVLGFAGIRWLVSARKWYAGPKVQGTAEELAAIEADLGSV
jgi:hypothetical protein